MLSEKLYLKSKLKMTPFNIFISSSDTYADIWPVFFDLFEKFWPEFDGTIYLQTEDKEYQHNNLQIVCTKVGKHKYFGETLRAGLKKIPDDSFLFLMIDYMFMGKVNHKQIVEYYSFFQHHDADSLRLIAEHRGSSRNTQNLDILECLPPSPNSFFSYQTAFWVKKKLIEMVLPHETPWSSEWWGDKRAHILPLKLYAIHKGVSKPILYDARGCLHRGKWLSNAIEFCKEINYPIDISQRGEYQNEYIKLSTRLKLSWMLKRDGIKGSYWDLIKKKYFR